MRKICKEKLKLERFELPREEAIKFMEEKDEPYKVELINDLPEDAVICFYKQGEFTDLCAGPHLDSTGRIKGNGIKLTACNGCLLARRQQARRCSSASTASPSRRRKSWTPTSKQREEAVKRDHNKLGRELEYFTTVDCIGQGLPVLLPKGARVIQLLQRWVEDTEQKRGYLLTKTPLMAKRDLYKISGHWDHYLDGMFVLGDPYDETKECFALRPDDLPVPVSGLSSTAAAVLPRPAHAPGRDVHPVPQRGFRRDARPDPRAPVHHFRRPPDPASRPAGRGVQGLPRPGQVLPRHRRPAGQVHVPLLPVGSREPEQQVRGHAGAVGSRPERDGAASSTTSTSTTPSASTRLRSTARSWTSSIRTSTARKTPSSPSRSTCCWPSSFGMDYIDADGEKKLPYIIHRTSLGCYERTLAYLIEEYAGALPTWMAPEQVRFLPVTDRAERLLRRRSPRSSRSRASAPRSITATRRSASKIRDAQTGEGALHGHRRRPRHGERYRLPAPPRGRRSRRDERGRVLRPAQATLWTTRSRSKPIFLEKQSLVRVTVFCLGFSRNDGR